MKAAGLLYIFEIVELYVVFTKSQHFRDVVSHRDLAIYQLRHCDSDDPHPCAEVHYSLGLVFHKVVLEQNVPQKQYRPLSKFQSLVEIWKS